MKFSTLSAKPAQRGSIEYVFDTLVLFAVASARDKRTKKSPKTEKLPAVLHLDEGSAELDQWLVELAKLKLFSGQAQEVYFGRGVEVAGARNVMLVGLGEMSKANVETVRQASAVAYQSLRAQHIAKVTVEASSVLAVSKNPQATAQAIVEGMILSSYSSALYKTNREESPVERVDFYFANGEIADGFDKGLKDGQVIAECVNFSRVLGDRPGNLMTPKILASEVRKAAQGTSIKLKIWGRDKIISEKMGSFLSVSLGSDQEPQFIVMEYSGGGKSRPLCLVGKGLTFDSGGISIKPALNMEEMKYDMCGGANVIGAMLAIARLKLKINAICLVPATENMPGPNANKPGDVVTARNGKTIEVNNTDAEGRLILADALVYASEQDPALILDAATLTGAMVVALGTTHTGYFCDDEDLIARVEEAAQQSGELLWRLPVTREHLKDMKGSFADLSNISSGKGAGSATAAAFLREFVAEGIPYAHFDIAGTAWHSGARLPYCPKKGASGCVIRTFIEIARGLER